MWSRYYAEIEQRLIVEVKKKSIRARKTRKNREKKKAQKH